MKITFGEYLPDLPDFENPGAIVAKNVIPSGASYKEFPDISVYSSNGLTARCQGAVFGKDASGNTFNFAGDVSKLYKLGGAAWADVSKVGGYTTGSDERWFFSTYGQRLLATNFTDAIQTYTMGSSSVFADLAATAPLARYIAQLNNFTVVCNTYDAVDGNVPHRVRWSGIADPTSWTVSASTQADFEDLESSNGWVKQVYGGEYGVVFQERAINRMSYVGSPIVFQFDTVETGRGLLASGGSVKIGNFIFYLGLDGFYVFDGNQSIPIGENKINTTFFSDVDLSYLDRIYSTADLDKQVVYWSYPGSGNNAGLCNKILMYNYAPNATKRWSYAEVNTEVIYISLSEGYTLDSLDTVSTNLDTLTPSLDSRVWTGDNYILSAFNSSHKLATFTGSALTATIDTTEGQLIEGSKAILRLLRPLVDGPNATITVQIGTRDNLTDSVAFGSAISANSMGEYTARSNARYHRARVNISGGFTHAQGIEVLKYTSGGRR